MWLVAIVEWEGVPEAGRAALAAAIGTTLYELRLAVAAGLPAIVLTTPDPSHAEKAVLAIQHAGGRAVSAIRQSAFANRRMLALRDFQLQPHGLTPAEASTEFLPYSDIFGLYRATHSTVTTSSQVVKEKKLDPAMAIITGGLKMSKTTSREVISRTDTREQVLYIYRKSGATPWLLRERSANYSGLGQALAPSSFGNFQEFIRILRERAPAAIYDDRFANVRPIRGISDGIEATDILVHLFALAQGYQPAY